MTEIPWHTVPKIHTVCTALKAALFILSLIGQDATTDLSEAKNKGGEE